MILAYARGFIYNIGMKVMKNDGLLRMDFITAEELEYSLNVLNGYEQSFLQAQDNYENLKLSFKLFTADAGFIRVKVCFGASTLTFQEECSKFLGSSADSCITGLFILEARENVYHSGIEATLA